MGRKYYYIGTLLPVLSLESLPDLSLGELLPILQTQLSAGDFANIQRLRCFYDIYNLRALWRQEPLDPRGSKDQGELEEVLAGYLSLSPSVDRFLSKYEKKEERLVHFPELLSTFLHESSHTGPLFLRQYFQLERDIRIVTTALRAKALGRDLAHELVFEDAQNPLLAVLLGSAEGKELDVPEEYKEIQKIFIKERNHPLSLQKGIDQYRFDAIERLCDLSDQFSIERILATFAQLLLVDDWSKLDVNEGKERVKALCQQVG